jgi:RNA polymerase sigma-70 factor (ECF subfamily)
MSRATQDHARQGEAAAAPDHRPHAAIPGGVRDRHGADADWAPLMRAAQAGDARAYDRLLRRITPMLRAIARRRIHDAAEAEDAVQDTLLTVHRLLHSYDPDRPIRPWLVAICERRCVDRLRRSGRRQRRETPLETLVLAGAEPSYAGAEGEAGVAAAQLRAAVEGLPPSQRTALRLAKLEGLSLAEAAARSGLTVGALKVATHRALRSLRRSLGIDLATL